MEAARDLSRKVSLDTTAGSKKLALKAVYPRNIPPNHSHQMDLQITLPRNTSITLHKEDGNIQIRNLEGQIEIGTENGDILCENVMADVRLVSEDGNVNIKKCRLTNLNIKKEDGNIHCDDISGNCDISLEDGDVTISYDETKAENCTCIVRGEDGNIKISRGTFAKCQVDRESGTIDCDNVRGNLDLKLHEGQVVVDYADNVPESCSINVQIEEGGVRLSAPSKIFPADSPSTAKRIDKGAEWTTKAGTPGGGTRTVSLRVDEGSVKVEKR
ncbi:MAG: hypothetical protein D4R45_03525 [Planctomycetaceae bacterium]|nr:MAG: hypothetical protein D4R45_03525 [Planctomycetaceae bacterium]